MKRSEAVQRVKEIHNRIFNVQMYEAFEEDELADMFLEQLQTELGLIPPTTTLNKLGVTDNAWESEEE